MRNCVSCIKFEKHTSNMFDYNSNGRKTNSYLSGYQRIQTIAKIHYQPRMQQHPSPNV